MPNTRPPLVVVAALVLAAALATPSATRLAAQTPTPAPASPTPAPRGEWIRTAPDAPFSQAVRVGETVWLSGVLGTRDGRLVAGGIGPETTQALQNMRAALERTGATLDDVVKCTVFLADMREWAAMNAAYVPFFPRNRPARSAVAVAGLALDARVEVECMAMRGAGR